MAQLQARYPTASLIAEFVTVHQESFVVRALVQVGGMPLATGMAAAADIEQAEDRAKVRALAALGIGSFTASLQSQPLASLPSTQTISSPTDSSPTDFSPSGVRTNLIPEEPSALSTPVAPLKSVPLSESVGQETPSTVSPSKQSLQFATPDSFADLPQSEGDRTPYELNYEPENYELENYESENYKPGDYSSEPDEPEIASQNSPLPKFEPEVEPLPETSSLSLDAPPSTQPLAAPVELPKVAAPTGKGKSAKRKTENTETAPPTTGENDRSEEIAKIGLEMKRLGWTTEQGRNYLKRTYGKRSRQELDDSELIDFLRYLETQVSPSESPF